MKYYVFLFTLLYVCSIAFGVDPIARYDFENNLNDAMGAYNLTATGTITYDTADKQVGTSSAVFNGSSFGSAAMPDLTQQTYAFWIYPTADGYPLSRDPSSRFEVRLLSGEILVYLNSTITIDTRSTGTLDVPLNQWTHVAITLDETAKVVNLYLNKVLWGTVSTSRTISGSPLYVGARAYNGGTSPFQGKLDDVRVYNIVLSTSDITALPPVTNSPPVVNAGTDGEVYLDGLTFALGSANGASAIDDGLPDPPASLTYIWSCSNPAVTFTGVNGINATANFPTPTSPAEVYTLMLTVSDGAANANDLMTVTVYNETATGGMVARYDFEQNLQDTSGAPYYSLTETGSITYSASNKMVGSYAGVFDGSSFGTAALPDLTQQTYMFWIYPTADGYPLSRDIGSTTRFEVRLLSGEILVYLNSTITIDTRDTAGTLDVPFNEWTHVAITLDETEMQAKLYINDNLWKSVSTSRTISGAPLYVGARAYSGGSSAFQGLLDDVRVYDYIWDSNDDLCSILDVTALTDDISVNATTKIKNGLSNPPVSVLVRQLLYQDEDTTQAPFLELSGSYQNLASGQTVSVTLSQTGLQPQLWSPEFPNLYLLRTQIVDASNTVLAQRDDTIGFRKFKAVGKNFYLNGKPVYLFGLAQTPPNRIPNDISNDPAFIAQHIARLKQMNVNYVRVHDDTGLWFDACDRAGIMVFTGGYSTGGYDYSLPIVRDVVMVAKNHPSVCVYVTGNEWDDAQIATDAKLMYDAVKAIDPSRLQFIAWTGSYYNGSNPKSIQDQIGSDFLDYHTYSGWYSGESYNFYNYHSSESFPVTISECVGAYTNKDPNGGGFTLSGTGHNKSLGAALRKIGHSYNWNEDSLAYQSWLAGEVTETCRRDRSTTRSMCGPVPFTDSYAYEYSYNPDDKTEYPKPVIDRLAKAYEPVHVSIRNTAPNQYAGNTMTVKAFVLNDDCTHYYPALAPTTLSFNLLDAAGTSVWSGSYAVNSVNYYATWSKDIVIAIPESLSTGKYTLRAKLSLYSNDLSITDSDIFVASQSWTRIVHTETALVAVYDTSGQTITELEGLGVPLAVISNFSNLTAYGKLIIGKDSFNATVAGAESSILSFINSGKRVLILEQNSTDSKNAFNASGWLGTGLSYYATAGYGESFVNIERPYLNTLMNDLKRSDFSNWNNMATGEPQDRDLYSRPIVMGYNDMDHCAVLANAGSHLQFPVLVEIFPIGGTGGSCILSQLYTVGRNTPDSKATKYLANLVDYLIEEQAHYQYITAEPTIKFGDFKSERGAIFSDAALQGMVIANSGDWKGERNGRTFVGRMQVTSLRLYEGNPATTERCPLYLRSSYEVGNNIIVDVGNNHTATLNYTLYVNGQATTTKQVTPGTRQQDSFSLTPIAPGTNIKLEIEADEGEHFDTHDTGLIFYSIKLYDSIAGDLNYDGQIDLSDFAELSKGWGIEYGIDSLQDIASYWLQGEVF